MLVGARPLTAVADEPLPDAADPTAEPTILLSLAVENGPLNGLLLLRATARPNDPLAKPLDAVELVRWTVDPTLFESSSSEEEPAL